jgi:hypothetical protein
VNCTIVAVGDAARWQGAPHHRCQQALLPWTCSMHSMVGGEPHLQRVCWPQAADCSAGDAADDLQQARHGAAAARPAGAADQQHQLDAGRGFWRAAGGRAAVRPAGADPAACSAQLATWSPTPQLGSAAGRCRMLSRQQSQHSNSAGFIRLCSRRCSRERSRRGCRGCWWWSPARARSRRRTSSAWGGWTCGGIKHFCRTQLMHNMMFENLVPASAFNQAGCHLQQQVNRKSFQVKI